MVGQSIEETAHSDAFGHVVSISADGKTVAAGGLGINNLYHGQVGIYRLSGNTWVQMGSDLIGENDGDSFGWSIDLNENGETIIVGDVSHDSPNYDDAGYFKVLKWNGTDWVQKGNAIDGEYTSDEFGISVSIDASGNTIAVGSRGFSGVGYTKVYAFNNNSWVQKGTTFMGGNYNGIGHDVNLSANGNILALGIRENDANGTNSGSIWVYEWNGLNWMLRGNEIHGTTTEEQFGFSVDITPDGNTIIAGAPQSNPNGFYSGLARVYKWNGVGWVQKGLDLGGSEAGEFFGHSVAINSDGDVISIGAPYWLSFATDFTGYVKTYKWDGSQWNLVGLEIFGAELGSECGFSIDLNDIGDMIAIGAPSYQGPNDVGGHLRVFQNGILNTQLLPINFLSPLFITPNPFEEKLELQINNNTSINEISIINLQGQTVFIQNNQSQKLTIRDIQLNKGIYLIRVLDSNHVYHIKKVVKL